MELRFGAPEKRGTYTYTVIVKSDSYIDQEYSKDVKVGGFHLSSMKAESYSAVRRQRGACRQVASAVGAAERQ